MVLGFMVLGFMVFGFRTRGFGQSLGFGCKKPKTLKPLDNLKPKPAQALTPRPLIYP